MLRDAIFRKACRVARQVIIALTGSGMLMAAEPGIEEIFELPLAPACMTVSPKGTYLIGVSSDEKPQNRAVEVTRAGDSKPFPSTGIAQGAKEEPVFLDAVKGMVTDSYGIVWMLDSGRRSELPIKLLSWDYAHRKLHRVLYLVPPAVLPSSAPVDLAVDPEFPYIYLADPAAGVDAALIVVDLATGVSRRVLQGHPSVQPEASLVLNIDGAKIESKRLDGTSADPIGGVTPLALDRKGEWLYFGPLRSTRLYRIKTEHLRNAALSSEKLAGLVELYADKPLCAGITLDTKGNIYVSDLAAKAIGMISAGSRLYKLLATDPRLLWPDGLCFGPDGRLCFFTNTRRAQTTSARRSPITPIANHLFRLQTPGSGRAGD